MHELRRLADFTVAKGTGFGLLAICVTMVGFSYAPGLALQAGGLMTLLMTLILLVKAHGAPRVDHRRTEVWMLLDKDARPAEAHARWAVATVLRETYTTFAMRSSALAVGLLASALVVRLAGFK